MDTADFSAAALCATPAQGTPEQTLPPWWLGDPETFMLLFDRRRTLHRRDKHTFRRAWTILLAPLLPALVAGSADAAGSDPVASSAILGLALAFVAFGFAFFWFIDVRLSQQIEDAGLRARLWLDLLAALKDARVEIIGLAERHPAECEIGTLLRREFQVAHAYAAAPHRFDMHVPLFGYCFALSAR